MSLTFTSVQTSSPPYGQKQESPVIKSSGVVIPSARLFSAERDPQRPALYSVKVVRAGPRERVSSLSLVKGQAALF